MKKLSQKEVIQHFIKVHGKRYNYSKVIYKNARTKIKILCHIHGPFYQKAHKHFAGQGCSKCRKSAGAVMRRKTTEAFIKDAKAVHGNRYNYDKAEYGKNGAEKVIIICPLHGEFTQKPQDHLASKAGCPACLWKNHSALGCILKETFAKWILIPNKCIWTSYKRYKHRRYCDYWLQKGKQQIMIEYDGQQHFRPVTFGGMSYKKALKQFKRQLKIDALDKEFCKENHIKLFRIKAGQDLHAAVTKLAKQIK